MDVDGVMSDGRIIYDSRGNEYKCFDAHDGFGISRARERGLKLAVISGRTSKVVTVRTRKLGITDVFQNIDDKISAFRKIQKKYKLKENECCFIGDDEFDLPLLRIVGLSCSPADAMRKVKSAVDYVTEMNGGRGAIREILDMILDAQGLL